MARAVCSRLKPSANGSTIACAARSSAAVLAFFNRSIATSSCSAPLAFRAMIASTKGKGYIITVSICNWNKGKRYQHGKFVLFELKANIVELN
jgi:hypothetical protein